MPADTAKDLNDNDKALTPQELLRHPIPSFSFVLTAEGAFSLPLKSVHVFNKENEYEYIKEGGVNDYVHMKRKPISKPFTFQIERYVGTETDLDPLANGTELMMPLILNVYRQQMKKNTNDGSGSPDVARTYIFTGCIVISKEYGELNAEKSGLLIESTTIAYRELVVLTNAYKAPAKKAATKKDEDKVYENSDGHLKRKDTGPLNRPAIAPPNKITSTPKDPYKLDAKGSLYKSDVHPGGIIVPPQDPNYGYDADGSMIRKDTGPLNRPAIKPPNKISVPIMSPYKAGEGGTIARNDSPPLNRPAIKPPDKQTSTPVSPYKYGEGGQLVKTDAREPGIIKPDPTYGYDDQGSLIRKDDSFLNRPAIKPPEKYDVKPEKPYSYGEGGHLQMAVANKLDKRPPDPTYGYENGSIVRKDGPPLNRPAIKPPNTIVAPVKDPYVMGSGGHLFRKSSGADRANALS